MTRGAITLVGAGGQNSQARQEGRGLKLPEEINSLIVMGARGMLIGSKPSRYSNIQRILLPVKILRAPPLIAADVAVGCREPGIEVIDNLV